MKKIVDIAELSEFDFRTGELVNISVDETIPKRLSEELEEMKNRMGLKLFIQGVDDPEHFVRSYYENKGYIITRLPYCSCSWEDRDKMIKDHNYSEEVEEFVKSNYSLIKNSYIKNHHELFNKPGVPDFLAVKLDENKHVKDLFFVEVKSSNDAVRYKQLLWVFSSNVPSKLVYCKDQKKMI